MKQLNRILIADDEADIRKVVCLSLQHLSTYDVKMCEDGRDAVEKAADYAPDLIILDVMMPDLDGIRTFEKLREIPETSNTPIVFLTARIQGDEVETYRALGAINVIGKPFHPVELPKIIAEIWERHVESSAEGDRV
ncbi:MAG: response regulator [Pseudomonadota bacterium]